jgi:hydroxypyruvate reductase
VSAELATALARAAVAAVEPHAVTRAALESVRSAIDRPCTLFAFGKAARGMAEAACETVDAARGIVIALDDAPLGALAVRRGAHPSPCPDAVRHGDEVLALARSLGPDDLALVLISGGGSSMLERPVAGLTLDDVAATSRALMHAGADIAELNAVRRCLSQVKGGGLAEALHPAAVITVVISDVPGEPTSVVASGPCSMPDARLDPREVIARRGVMLEPAIRRVIDARADARPRPEVFARVREVLAADVRTAMLGMQREATRRGLDLVLQPELVRGEARVAGPRFVRDAQARCRTEGHDGVIAGGETTVTVRGSGRGGRNHEAALAALLDGAPFGTFVASTTDGIDGSSDAAAVWIDDAVRERAHALGLDARAALDANDSHRFFETAGARWVTGATGTNVADVWAWIGRQ